jgi:NDP-mannose synthase
MRAVILAGGKGVRLKPYTSVFPKPLVPIGGELPILEIVIKQLKNNGFNHITIAVNHLANLIMAFFGDGEKWGVKIDYSIEEKPLSTIGPLTLIDDLPANFLVMNGDILTDLSFATLMQDHVEKGYDLSVASYVRKQQIDFGVLETDTNSSVIGFKEKPEYTFRVSMGVHILNRSILDKLESGKEYGFDNLMLDSINNGLNIHSYAFDGYWLDIGRPDDYNQANEDYPSIKNRIL